MVSEDELVVLLHKAGRNGVALQATLRRWSNAALSRLAMQQAHPDGFSTAMYRPPTKGEEAASETQWWVIEAPDGRHRWELRSQTPESSGVRIYEQVTVDDGARTIQLYHDHAVISRSGRPSALRRLLDPAWLLTHDLEVISEGNVNDRPTVTACARRRPNRPASGGPTDMAPERRIVVDGNEGFLHADTALLDNEPYETMELLDLHLGPVTPGSFTLQLPPGLRVLDATKTQERQRTPRWPLRWVGFRRYGWPRLDPARTQIMGSESGTPPFF